MTSRTTETTTIAVLTGDLIGSTRVPEPAAFRNRLGDLLGQVADTFQAQTNLFRGDGFQVAVDRQVNAFRLAVLLRAGLICRSPGGDDRWDARVAIAYGTGRLSQADQNSEAWVNSGRTLDGMENDHLRIHGDNEVMQLATGAATAFADDILNHLTPTEAEVLYYHLLEPGTHQSIADKLGKKRPTITMALQRARYQLLDRYIHDMDRLARLSHE